MKGTLFGTIKLLGEVEGHRDAVGGYAECY